MEEENTNMEESQLGMGEEQADEASAVTFAEIEPGLGDQENANNMDFLLDVPLEISVRLGKTRISIGDLLKLNQGSVVELDTMTSQPLEVYVNDKLMAEGEVVVVNDKFGIRLINIVSPGERVKNLT